MKYSEPRDPTNLPILNLSPKNDVQKTIDCQEASDPSANTLVSIAQSFPLPRLPLEIQLLVLQQCLISKTPLLDYGAKPGGVHLTVIDESRGQDNIGLGILGTCKFYHKEGLRLLYAHNQFSYTEIFDTQKKNWWSQLPLTFEELKPKYLNYPTQHFPNLKQLILRAMGMTKHLGSWVTAMSCKHILAQCPYLQTLQLDIVDLPLDSQWGTRQLNVMRSLVTDKRLWSQGVPKQRQEPRELRAANGGLRQIVFTGLEADFCCLLAVIQASRMLADGGKLGVGIGWDGRRFRGMVQERYVIPKPRPELSLIWLDFQDIEPWIEENREGFDPSGFYGRFEIASKEIF